MIKQDHYGLGYKLDGREKRKQIKSKREIKMANLKGCGVEGEPMLFPHLYETFRSVGLEHDDTSPNRIVGLEDFVALSINSINEENVKVEDIRALVRPHPSRYKLNN